MRSSTGTKDESGRTRPSVLARLRGCDEQGWQTFFDTYYRLMYAAVARRSIPPHDTEDIVAQIVEGVARRIPDFVYDPAKCRFRTWLFRIVEKRVAEYFRTRARRLPQASSTELVEYERRLEEMSDPKAREPDQHWDEAWEANQIQVAVDRVRKRADPRYMQLYLYSEMEGHSVAETAAHFGTATAHVSQARLRVGRMLREEGERLRREERLRETMDLISRLSRKTNKGL
jgi:RNA polymerase sigma-70 factor, ECF subfamily